MIQLAQNRRVWFRTVSSCVLAGLMYRANAQDAGGQDVGTQNASPPDVATTETSTWRFGVSVSSRTATLEGVHATFTIPKEWPEQKIRIVDEQFSPYVVAKENRDSFDLARQVVLRMARIPPGAAAESIVTVEVQKTFPTAPDPTIQWKIPERPEKELKLFLTSSPYIDPRHAKIKRAATEIASEGTDDGWALAERIYDWVREKVAYREGDIKTAIEALDDGNGDCEELTSLFVAICRASRIPARMVWVPGHAYPEFHLVDDTGKGTWFPCQVAGNRQFGEMIEARPILQKGDRFKVPEHRDVQRYLAEYCKVDAVRGTGKPAVRFISEKVVV